MSREYGKLLTRDYLENVLGITEISEDGKHIYKNGHEMKQTLSNEGYFIVTLYDKIKYSLVPLEKRNPASGYTTYGVHRVVYAWFNKYIPSGLVVDHIDDNKLNNNKDNLQLKTPSGNVWKYREHDIKEVKCDLSKPRSYYEEKLAFWESCYELAKENGDQDRAHKLRTNLSNTKARLRYYDSHKEN